MRYFLPAEAMSQKMRNAVALASVLLLSLWVLAPASSGAAELGFATNKSLFDAEILPGTTYEDRFIVFNSSKELALPIHVQMALWNLKEGSEEDIEFITSQEAINPVRWFSLVLSGKESGLKSLASGYDFILEPDEVKELTFRVRPPNDVAPGTYLVSMRLQAALPDHYFETTGPQIVPEVAILFFLKVPYFGLEAASDGYQAEIVEFGRKKEATDGLVTVAQAGILDSLRQTLVAKVKNTGPFYFKATGEVVIHNWLGKEVKRVGLPGKYLLPDRTRTLDIPVSSESSVTGLFARVSDFVKENSYAGRYTATLFLHYPTAQASEGREFSAGSFIQSEVSFWVFPWKLILWIAGLIVLARIVIRRYGKRFLVALRVLAQDRE